VLVRGGDVGASAFNLFSFTSLHHWHGATAIENAAKSTGSSHVHHHEDRSWQIPRKLPQERAQRVKPPSEAPITMISRLGKTLLLALRSHQARAMSGYKKNSSQKSDLMVTTESFATHQSRQQSPSESVFGPLALLVRTAGQCQSSLHTDEGCLPLKKEQSLLTEGFSIREGT
jgi:hypothetical protein